MAVDPKYQGYSIGSKLLDAIKQNAFIHDRKTGKPNTLYLKPVQTELLLYRQWLLHHQVFYRPSS
ncbi:hypothetical protein R5R49_07080, partial [Oenococcus oeni]